MLTKIFRFLYDLTPKSWRPKDKRIKLYTNTVIKQELDVTFRSESKEVSQGPIIMVSLLDVDYGGNVYYGKVLYMWG